MVGALSGLVLGRLGEADFMHIYGARSRFAYSGRPLGEHTGCIFMVIAWPFGGQDQETLQISFLRGLWGRFAPKARKCSK